jgi:hypothetical protein
VIGKMERERDRDRENGEGNWRQEKELGERLKSPLQPSIKTA